MNPQRPLTAEEARASHLQQVRRQKLRRAALPLQAPYLAALRNDGSLPAGAFAADLPVRIPAQCGSPQPGEGLQLLWDGRPVGATRWLSGDEAYPLRLDLPRELLVDREVHALSYQLIAASGNRPTSAAVRVALGEAFDNAGNVQVDAEIEEIGLTLDYLEKHRDQVRLRIPTPPRLAAYRHVELYWRTARGGVVMAARLDIGPNHWAGEPIEVELSGEFLRQHADCSAEVSYAFCGTPGQCRLESAVRSIALYLTPLPATLPEPCVPLAADPIGIDLADVFCGVSVAIPAFEHARSGDRLVLYWGRERLPATTVDDPDESAFPLWLDVPVPTLLRAGSGRVRVFYELHRGDVVLTSSAIGVAVDLDTVGPSGRLVAGAVNPALATATVQGARSGYANEITPADVDKPASAQEPFYPAAEVDDILRLYWGSQRAPATLYRVTHADLERRAFEPIAIPWSCVAQEGNARAVAVRYSISSTSNGNQVYSPTTPVDVHFALPGGPDRLAAVTLPGLNEQGWLVPVGSPQSIPVSIPAYRNIAVGDLIRLYWRYEDGTPSAPLERSVEAARLECGIALQIDFPRLAQSIALGGITIGYSVIRGECVYRGPERLVHIDTRGIRPVPSGTVRQPTEHFFPWLPGIALERI